MYFPVSAVTGMRCVAIFLICLVHATLITSAQAPVSRASAGHGKVDLLGITGAAKGSCCGGESRDALGLREPRPHPLIVKERPAFAGLSNNSQLPIPNSHPVTA